MIKRYLETRGRIHNEPANVMGDVMRHFHARRHLGKAVILCDDPDGLWAIAQKQWLKLSRLIQRERGTATNAVEILKHTYTITQMQHVVFAAASPVEQPEADAYFLAPGARVVLPGNCFSLYVTTEVSTKALARLIAGMPAGSLVVDYTGQVGAGDFGLQPKAALEEAVMSEWRSAVSFLSRQQIHISELADARQQTERMDDALDMLLGVSDEFLDAASRFARALDLARPLRSIGKEQRSQFEVFMLLAHRVQTLAPGGFSVRFLNTYADDTFFLSDNLWPHESLAELIERQERAGRERIVQGLLTYSTADHWLAAI